MGKPLYKTVSSVLSLSLEPFQHLDLLTLPMQHAKSNALLVVSTGNPQHVALELITERVGGNFLAHPLLHEHTTTSRKKRRQLYHFYTDCEAEVGERTSCAHRRSRRASGRR